jgi:hypothetical protein
MTPTQKKKRLGELNAAYAAARANENRLRAAAFCPAPRPLLGVEVAQMTLRHWVYLENLDSPLLNWRESRPPVTGEDVAVFLNVVTPGFYDPATQTVRREVPKYIFKSIARLGVKAYIGAILEYLEIERQDHCRMSPDASAIAEQKHLYWAAGSVLQYIKITGWGLDAILDSPLSLLYQLRDWHLYFNDKKQFFLSKSMPSEDIKAAYDVVLNTPTEEETSHGV